MHVVAVDGAGVDRHLQAARNLAQQLACPLPHITHEDRVPTLCDPNHMVLAVPDRVTALLEVFHAETIAFGSPKPNLPSHKGEGLTDPQYRTLNNLTDQR